MNQMSLFGDEPAEPPRPAKPEKEAWEKAAAEQPQLRHRQTPCQSCGAMIVFAQVERKGGNGVRPHPVDVDEHPAGTVHLWMEGRYLRGKVLTKAQAKDRSGLHRSHFATCPKAAEWKSGGPRR